jgi:hypothetical protein
MILIFIRGWVNPRANQLGPEGLGKLEKLNHLIGLELSGL